jgi:hypothetical protein
MLKESNHRGNWNHLKIIQIPEQNTGQARHRGTTENSHSGHCTRFGNTDVKVLNIQHGK